MFFPSPSTWKMVKYAPNYVLMNIIGLSQKSREILEDGYIPILLVVIITTDYLQSNSYRTGIPLYTFWAEVNKICILPYVQCQNATAATS